MDGEEIGAQGHAVAFSFEGVDYESDLSQANLDRFRLAIAPYRENGRRVGGRRSRAAAAPLPPSSATPVDNRAVRAWAASNGIDVSGRGRIPAHVVSQFRAAGN
jgi:hypothetical protein